MRLACRTAAYRQGPVLSFANSRRSTPDTFALRARASAADLGSSSAANMSGEELHKSYSARWENMWTQDGVLKPGQVREKLGCRRAATAVGAGCCCQPPTQ